MLCGSAMISTGSLRRKTIGGEVGPMGETGRVVAWLPLSESGKLTVDVKNSIRVRHEESDATGGRVCDACDVLVRRPVHTKLAHLHSSLATQTDLLYRIDGAELNQPSSSSDNGNSIAVEGIVVDAPLLALLLLLLLWPSLANWCRYRSRNAWMRPFASLAICADRNSR